MFVMPVGLNPSRIIEIMGIGRFYVAGDAPFVVVELVNEDKAFSGFIIVSEKMITQHTIDRLNKYNSVYRVDEQNKAIAKLLIKNKDMAEEICFACNRIK